MSAAGRFAARVLVTGAAGFVGANLCRAAIEAGASVHGVVRPGSSRQRLESLVGRMQVHEADLRHADAVTHTVGAIQPDVVFHTAVHNAYRHSDRLSEVVADNVSATALLIETIAGLNATRLVHLGGSTEYGPSPSAHHEDDPLKPSTRHGSTKAAATLIVAEQARSGVVDAVVLRLFSVYGPLEPSHRLIPQAIRAARTGSVLPLTVPGLRHDYVYVDDVTDACLRAAITPGVRGEVINIGSGTHTTNEEVVAVVEQVLGRRIATDVGAYAAHAGDAPTWVADIRRAATLLGWHPQYALADGVAKTVASLEGVVS